MRTSLLIAAGAMLLAAACCCCGLPSNWDFNWDWDEFFGESPTPEPTPHITRDPLPEEAYETAMLLEQTVIPVRDLHGLAIRLRGLPADTPNQINPQGSPDYEVGTRRVFNASNVDTDAQFQVTAILRYKTDHVYMWVEEGVSVDMDELEAAAELFEEHTYPTNRAFFGSEWNPGVDNDPHLSILHARNLGSTVAGYYSSADEFVQPVRDDSNEMEMFYINIQNVTINSDFYNGVLAHEFQHMIHWHNDRNEDTWLNEGFSELASYINGFDPGGSEYSFARRPDTQLNSWPEGPGAAGANYGAAYLFTSYFLDHFGAEASQALVSHDENSMAAVDAVLQDLGTGMTHQDLFADWVVANLIDDPTVGSDQRYGYNDIDPPTFSIDTNVSSYPYSRETTVAQYGTDYIEVQGDSTLSFSFVGSTQVGLVNAQAHSGQYLWWSNRGDDSDMTLTGEFDLSGVSNATLEYWCWYQIEEDWDYTYVEVSTDGGETWQILTTPSGTATNPNGNSFGWGYTGNSGGSTPQWIQERVDLSPYAGQTVQIRFEYITDDAVNQPGFVLDDVAIPEIGYLADFEAGEAGWIAKGFIRHANVLPQQWLVQLVLFGPETTVQRLVLDENQAGQWDIPLDSNIRRVVVAVSAFAPVTTEPASYRYDIAK
ncbi:MAG: immune inhibitor A [Anaerolineae bacterium]|nr:immune inhibitor A [Anaerolineae bacterium]